MMSLHNEHLSSQLCRVGWLAYTCLLQLGTQSKMDYSAYLLRGWFVSSLLAFPRTTIWSWWTLKGARKELGRQCDLAANGKEVPKPTDSFKSGSLCRSLGTNIRFFSYMCKKSLFHSWGASRWCWRCCSITVSVGAVGFCARWGSQLPCPRQRGSELPTGITGSPLGQKLCFSSLCV